MPGKKVIEEIIQTDEEDEDVLHSGDEDETDDEEDFMDMGGLLSSLLTTEEGDNVTTALVKMTLVMQKQMETQNKILVKILSCMKKES